MNEEKKRKKIKEITHDMELTELKTTSIFNQEEESALKRDEAEDQLMQEEAIQHLYSLINQIHSLKTKQNKENDISKLKVQGLLHLMTLKKLNRVNHFKIKNIREITSQSKLKSEQNYLTLQNLLYEILHFEKEIARCLQFRSEDEDIALISVEEFAKTAHPHTSNQEISNLNEHQLTLARLHWELEERKRLSAKLDLTSSEKEETLLDLLQKKKYLDDLKPMLDNILQSTRPIQEQLKMPYDEIRLLHEKASHLPPPLYSLYLQVESLSSRNKLITVNITGDWNSETNTEDLLPILDEDSSSDDELEKKHHRRSTSESQLLHKKERLFKKHPLAISMQINTNDIKLGLNFKYFTSLKLVTLAAKVDLPISQISSSASASDLFDGDSLLICLYAGDDGLSTPNPNNLYFLKELGIKNFVEHLGRENGRAYQWVQRLCGLQFLESKVPHATAWEEGDEIDEEEGYEGMLKQSLKRVKKRIQNRASLIKQLASLENNITILNSRNVAMFPPRIISSLKQWKRITFNNYQTKACNHKVVESKLITKSDYIFFGIIERKVLQSELQSTAPNEASLSFYVVLSSDYPNRIPLFTLVVNYAGEENAINNEHIREMESAVNLDWETKQVDDLILTNQILRLQLSFDVYLECGIHGFTGEKMMLRRHKGRCRSLPYHYNPEVKIYTQRANHSDQLEL